MVALVALTASDAEHVLAQFSGAVENVTAAVNWKVTSPAGSQKSAVVKALPRAGNLLVDLVVSPGMSKDVVYTFQALHATAGGAALAPGDDTATVTPSYVSKGAADVPHRVFSAFMQSLAEEFNKLCGKPQTLLVDEWQNDWDVLPVESTLRFPTTGRFWLDGEKYSYTGRTASTLTGVAPVRPLLPAFVSAKSLVTLDLSSTDDPESLPFTEVAFRETVVNRAPEDALKELARMFQLPCPGGIHIESWRDAMIEVLYAARGTRGNMHMFLERALSQYDERFVCSVAPANPHRLTWVSGGLAGGFEARHVGRLVRVASGLYYTVGPSFVGGPAVSPFLELCPVATHQWQAAIFHTAEEVYAHILPFVWTDGGAVFYLWGEIGAGVPPTFLQPAVIWGASSAGGVPALPCFPFGSDVADPPQWQQPATMAAYVVTEQTAGTWRYLIANADTDSTPARGGSHQITLYKTPAGGGPTAATALTCAVAAAGTTGSDLTHSATFAAGDLALLRVEAGAGVTAPLGSAAGAFRASIYIDPPGGEPKGGYLLDNAWIDGDQTVGPWPIYLGTELDAELMLVVTRLLAAGVVPRANQVDFDAVNALL